MAAIPAGASKPAASSSAILILFGRDQPLPDRRGVSSNELRSSSTPRAWPSIQPKHKASRTRASYERCRSPAPFL